MKVVEPIRDLDVLQRMYEIARRHDCSKGEKDAGWELILLVGFNTSLRISDLRRFRVKDLRGRDYAQIKAQKTGKEARILINPGARRGINRLLTGRRDDEWILSSRQRDSLTHAERAISRQRAWQIINHIAREAGVQERVGCHTLRKTFGFWYYKQTGDVVSLQRILGHTSRRDTLVYIGVVQDDIDESLKSFNCLLPKRMTGE